MTTVSLEEKEKQNIKIMGINVPRWQDCNRCKARLACSFSTYTYDQPCAECKNTPEYIEETTKPKGVSITQALESRTVASVFEGGGRTYYVNSRGNVIKDEKSRPLKVGDKKWK